MLHNSVPAKNVAELIALSKKQQITLGTSGVGSASHLTLARFNAATGANITHVPYRGGGALMPDVLAGTDLRRDDRDVDAARSSTARARSASSRWRRTKRSTQAPDVPTLSSRA